MTKTISRRSALAVFASGAATSFAGPAFAYHDGGLQAPAPRTTTPRNDRITEADAQFGAIPLRDSDAYLGDPNAPVTLIKYGSLTCPHCAAFHVAAAAEMKRDHIPNGRVRYIHRHFPLNQPAMAAAMLLHSGNDSPERFYGLLDILYTEQSEWAASQDYLSALRHIAIRTGLNAEQFDFLLSDRILADRIISERDEGAEKYGVNATPTLLINGGRYSGNRNISQLNTIFDGLG